MIDIVLLILKVAILVLRYVFVWRIVRSAVANVRAAAGTPEVAMGGPGPASLPHPGVATWQTPVDYGRSPRPRLVVEESPVLALGTEYLLDGSLTLGRVDANDVVVSETVVSGTHARLVGAGAEWTIEDLGSTNGTFVDGERVAVARLASGARVRVGDTVFRFED